MKKKSEKNKLKDKVRESQLDWFKQEKTQLASSIYLIQNSIIENLDERLNARSIILKYLQILQDQNEHRYMGLTYAGEDELTKYLQQIPLSTLFPSRIWDLSFTKQFLQRLQTIKEDDLMRIVTLIKVLAQGRFYSQDAPCFQINGQNVGSIKYPFQYDYEVKFQLENQIVLIELQIFPKKYPLMNGQQHPKQFDYVHEMIFVDLSDNGKSSQKHQLQYENYLKTQQSIPNFFSDMKYIQEGNFDKKQYKYSRIGEMKGDLIGPRIFKPLICSDDQFIYNKKLNLWMTLGDEEKYYKKLQQYEEIRSHNYTIQKYCNLPSSQQLLTIIKNIPNFKVKLTQEQENVISYGGDALVIGRSGTGKTTCALLKLFSTDILYKLRINLDKIKNQNSDILLSQQDQNTQLKTIFVTASPLLACQVKRLYEQLVNNIQNVINTKRQRQTKVSQNNEQSENIDLEQSTFQIIEALQQNENEIIDNQQQEVQKDQEIEDEDISEFEKEMGKFNKFSEIKQYPVFLTLRKLLALIDSSLLNSFFKIYGGYQTKSSQWHNESFGIMSLDQNQVSQAFNEELLHKQINLIDNQEFIETNLQEVTLEVFERVFWPKIVKLLRQENIEVSTFDPTLVWSEICTKIKGHETSHEYPNKYMNYENYSYYYRVLSLAQTNLLYKAFETYERLKQSYGYYDLLDIVNHINYELTQGNDVIECVHYLMLDELQDVPRAVLVLLDRMAEFGLFCCGDNAQNIAKGIGFKFFEVQNCLSNYRGNQRKRKTNLKLFDLNINFRSHNQILQLANSVIRVLELYFPYKIDRLKKETSDLTGPKPIVLQTEDPQDLLSYIQEFFTNERKTVEFGCNQAIIVKDQESKDKLPQELQNALVLTIYEAKGLEFDDVILFNFFNDCTTSIEDWKSLNELEVQSNYMTQEQFRNYQTIHQTEIIAADLNAYNKLIEIKQLKLSDWATSRNYTVYKESNQENVSLCQDLKQLYVAITRPKRKLIIFDQSNQKRQIMQSLWQKLDVVEIFQKRSIQVSDTQFILEHKLDNKANWKKQGYKMFRLNNYDQAAKCFQFSGDEELAKKSRAYFLATQANIFKENYANYVAAGRLFEEINLKLRGAQCYFSGKDYAKAYELYKQTDCKNEIAESAYFAGYFEEAGDLFYQMNDLRRALDCYRKADKLDRIFDLLNLHRNEFPIDERMAFLNKFFPSFLKDMTDQIEQQEKDMEEQNLIEEANLIQEDENDQSQSFQIENSIINESNQFQIENVQETLEQSQVSILKQDQQEIIEINDSQSFSVQNEESFDHLSIYDPEDEWLNNNKKSLIKSIATSSVESQFSNVLLLNQPSNVSLLKSRSNIFIKNNVLQQLIQKFQYFSEEFKNHIENQHYKSTLLSNRAGEEKEFDHMINFLYDLDNIDIDTIYIILDLLEQFKSYKLCIYVCNQFKLAQHLGRYLVSSASIYTPLTRSPLRNNYQIIANKLYRKQILEQAAVSQLAINNVLESINPIFLQFKFEDKLSTLNSFGIESYKELIGLGYWKTVIYQLNYEHAFNLCKSFNSISDIISVISKIQEKRELNEEEQFNFSKSQYIQNVQEALQSRGQNFNPLFSTTINYFQNNQQLNPQIKEDIIINSQITSSNLNYCQQLKQLEAIILSHLILRKMSTLDKEVNQDITQFIDIQVYFLNQMQNFTKNSNIFDSFAFLYQVSLPQGEIMDHYSQFAIVHLTSILISHLQQVQKDRQKNTQEQEQQQIKFIDIGFEYILTPYPVVLQAIHKSFIEMLSVLFYKISEKLNDYYLNQNDQQIKFTQNVYMSQTLLSLQELYYLEQKQKNVLPFIFKPKQLPNKQFKNYNNGFRNTEIDKHTSSILSQTKQLHQLDFFKILIKTNIRNPNLSSSVKRFLRAESISLLQMFQEKKQHTKIVLAINLLNYINDLPLAIFTLEQMKKPNITSPYIKYIEFLECQEQNITEDLLGCFAEFSSELQNVLFLDEQLYHLIRVGLAILISLLDEEKQKIIVPCVFLEFVKGLQEKKIEAPIFKINNHEIVVEYLDILEQFLAYCNSEHYEFYGNILLILFIVNLPTLTKEIIEQISKIIEFDSKYKFYQKLKLFIVKDLPTRQKEYLKQQKFLYIPKYLDLQIVALDIINSKNEQELQQIYSTCLSNWENYQAQSESIKQNGKQLITKWLKYKSIIAETKSLTKQEQQSQSQLEIVKFQQFYGLNHKVLNKYFNKQNIKFEENLKEAFAIQENIINQRHEVGNSLDLHFFNQLLELLSQLQLQISHGINVAEQLRKLSNEFTACQRNIRNFQEKEDELLARNKELLAIKWKNLKSGIKLKKKIIQKAEMQSIKEEEELEQ
ncbi:unnamed protein product (macronuclear) [Paramecium tetraurelia]|uniref:Uncharacterized protein n=1 Tax=Paramecium tetraurelia TaxID=5888 RepID=A0D4E1_PARTE|nr:uncharacterized protein GSPATT00013374001 [Paramecium tetraurelia]CAK77908.1 unnamed protein product [Paramecium tetraurelia]|eukprot:XP_001445305.1 hypothetical protein (macronuclear) [Paramecium tetraurelia strain d4-2]